MPRSTMRPHSVRYSDEEWAIFTAASIADPRYSGQVTTYVHDRTIDGHKKHAADRAYEAQMCDARNTGGATPVTQFREQTDRGGSLSDGAARDLLGARRWR